MFERNYSFYLHSCYLTVTLCSKNSNLSKPKWGAQAVVRRARPPFPPSHGTWWAGGSLTRRPKGPFAVLWPRKLGDLNVIKLPIGTLRLVRKFKQRTNVPFPYHYKKPIPYFLAKIEAYTVPYLRTVLPSLEITSAPKIFWFST